MVVECSSRFVPRSFISFSGSHTSQSVEQLLEKEFREVKRKEKSAKKNKHVNTINNYQLF